MFIYGLGTDKFPTDPINVSMESGGGPVEDPPTVSDGEIVIDTNTIQYTSSANPETNFTLTAKPDYNVIEIQEFNVARDTTIFRILERSIDSMCYLKFSCGI